MIIYILIALVSLFIAFCCGCAAGHSVGYRQAFTEMLPIVKKLEDISGVLVGTKATNEARGKDNAALRTPEKGDKGAP